MYYWTNTNNTINVEVLAMQKVYLPLYIIKSGDTLASLAEKFNVSPSQILVENYLTPAAIKEGMIISITKQ